MQNIGMWGGRVNQQREAPVRPTKACHGLLDVPARVLKLARWSSAASFDLPVDEQFKISASMFRQREGAVDYALGAALMWAGNGAIDQISQGVRVKSEFDKNWLLFLGGTLRYQF